MSTSFIYLCAIPRAIWEQPANVHGRPMDIARLVTDALACERRITKGINLEHEYSRYTLCCQRLEQAVGSTRLLTPFKTTDDFTATLQAGRFPVFPISEDYLSVLDHTRDKPGPERLGASFFPPDTLHAHSAAFAMWGKQHGVATRKGVKYRFAFLQIAQQAGCGVIELQSAYHIRQDSHPAIANVGSQPIDAEIRNAIVIPKVAHERLAVESFGANKQKLAMTLRNHIRAALTHGEPVVYGNEAQHDVIAEVLHESIFVPEEHLRQNLSMRVVYADGSEALPFPVFCLPRKQSSAQQQHIAPLRVALMSMRHLELDPEIDICWFRNRDVSRTRTLAETDQFCFTTTVEQINNALKENDIVIHLYHTGFEPAVLGFYRGIIHTLRNLRATHSSRQLVVVPLYYRGGTT
ncbi:MAG: hypothetical protein HC837_09515 [Chloroflexaceae bacterium]|nr:hypothetical protein [Chloroflexaceae bacterium]